jgi:hypothetical protein
MPTIRVNDVIFKRLGKMRRKLVGRKQYETHNDVITRVLQAYVPPGKD